MALWQQQWQQVRFTDLIMGLICWTVTDSLTFTSHVRPNYWPEDMNSTTVRCRSNTLSRVAECHCLDLSALFVVSVPRPIGSTPTIKSTALPHLHSSVIWTRRKVCLIITDAYPAIENDAQAKHMHRHLSHFYSFSVLRQCFLMVIYKDFTLLTWC